MNPAFHFTVRVGILCAASLNCAGHAILTVERAGDGKLGIQSVVVALTLGKLVCISRGFEERGHAMRVVT